MKPKTPGALGWPGGKAGASGTGTGRWIADRLPYMRGYAEPYAGMLGVLRQRRPSAWELANDLNGHLVNWWEVVRDHGVELQRMLAATPRWSEELFHKARQLSESEEDPVRRAYWFSLRTHWSYGKMGERLGTCFGTHSPRRLDQHIDQLSDRIRKLIISRRPAEAVLERLADDPDVVVYCDPPYADASTSKLYAVNDYNPQELTGLLTAQKGFVAVSGYGSEWDHLEGWQRFEHEAYEWIGSAGTGRRTEVLWVNQPDRVPGQGGLFDG